MYELIIVEDESELRSFYVASNQRRELEILSPAFNDAFSAHAYMRTLKNHRPRHRSNKSLKKLTRKVSDHNRRRKKSILYERQQGLCFYCGYPLDGDITFEHLIGKYHNGSNKLSNLRLAHGQCNTAVGHLRLATKMRLRKIARNKGVGVFFRAAKKAMREYREQEQKRDGVRGRREYPFRPDEDESHVQPKSNGSASDGGSDRGISTLVSRPS